jgi:post-segregation antitoxin (ccd killing protein)
MTVKLNLTIDKDVVQRSKLFAKRKNVSISKIVQEYLDKATQNEKEESFVEKYAGKFDLRIVDVKKAKAEYLNKKYGY